MLTNFNPSGWTQMFSLDRDPKDAFGLPDKAARLNRGLNESAALAQSLTDLADGHFRHLADSHTQRGRKLAEDFAKIWSPAAGAQPTPQEFADYLADFGQRSVLFLDIMRQVGNISVEQARAGGAPVLVYDYRMILDGRTFERPANYALVHILPPEGIEVDPNLRPYMLIDPRAGHGAGIGGFKSDSQVGVALSHGHPVYFVIFFQQPEPGQTLADVTAAEGRFVREVATLHPNAPKPVIVGNCQGGWATALLAATNPHVTGPVVLNGAPMSYWAGVRGKNPLRYLGGVGGGALPALVASDLGSGRFDGANLVLNFETMNPGNTWWRKYYNVFANVDTEAERFMGFERWWSNYYFMNEAEIRWIVENLFIGNRLQHGDAQLGGRGPVDLKRIKSPIIVFASEGDDITPPQQALSWIWEVYGDEREIRARGQRIIYMVHNDIGHLGIFVSAKVAVKEHDRIVNTLDMIEALAPGLYEMRIEQKIGEGIHAQYVMAVEERRIADLKALSDGSQDDTPFALVSRLSNMAVDAYETTARPMVQAMVTPAASDAMAQMHPLRLRRRVLSDVNPLMQPVAGMAEQVKAARKPLARGNPFMATEALFADAVEQALDLWSGVRAAQQELMFYALYANPFLAAMAGPRGSHAPVSDPNAGFGESLRELPQVEAALAAIDKGGFAEAVIRMLVLMARSRGAVRESRLRRSNEVLHSAAPFDKMGESALTEMIHQQTLIVDFEPNAGIAALPALLAAQGEKERAIALVEDIAGDKLEMSEPTARMLQRLRATLGMAAPAEAPAEPLTQLTA
jgi:pimeloyl-ACP methyl ester carboxylesterase/tellurite resistance protein